MSEKGDFVISKVLPDGFYLSGGCSIDLILLYDDLRMTGMCL